MDNETLGQHDGIWPNPRHFGGLYNILLRTLVWEPHFLFRNQRAQVCTKCTCVRPFRPKGWICFPNCPTWQWVTGKRDMGPVYGAVDSSATAQRPPLSRFPGLDITRISLYDGETRGLSDRPQQALPCHPRDSQVPWVNRDRRIETPEGLGDTRL